MRQISTPEITQVKSIKECLLELKQCLNSLFTAFKVRIVELLEEEPQ